MSGLRLKREVPAPVLAPAFDRIAKRIGVKLRDVYTAPEGVPLPIEHVDLLLRLRQKERELSRSS